jgi:DNA repair protein RadC
MEKILEVVRIKQVTIKCDEVKDFVITTPKDGAELAKKYIAEDDREVFLVIVLNTKNKVNAIHRCHVGSLNSSIVHPREVFKAAILNNGASIIVSHQHPSGDTNPSHEDIMVTKRLVDAGKIIGIEVLDHIIVSNESYYSLKENGYI